MNGNESSARTAGSDGLESFDAADGGSARAQASVLENLPGIGTIVRALKRVTGSFAAVRPGAAGADTVNQTRFDASPWSEGVFGRTNSDSGEAGKKHTGVRRALADVMGNGW